MNEKDESNTASQKTLKNKIDQLKILASAEAESGDLKQKLESVSNDQHKQAETPLMDTNFILHDETSPDLRNLSKENMSHSNMSTFTPQFVVELLDAVTTGTNIIISALDTNYRYIFFNQAYKEEIKNLTGHEIQVGMSLMEVYAHAPELLKVATEEWGRTLRGEKNNKTIKFGDPDRYQKIYNILQTPIRDGKGNVIGASSVATDVSEKEYAKAALHESETRYSNLFNSMSEGFALHEIISDETGQPVDYRFLDINPAFEKLTGFSREMIIGKTHNEVLPGDNPEWVQKYGQVALTGEPQHFEAHSPILKRDYEAFVYCPAPNQFAVIFSDITERKRSEETRNWLASFPEVNPQIVAVVDLKGVITYVNPAGKKLFPNFHGDMYQHPFLSGSEEIMEKFSKGEAGILSREVAVNDSWFKQTWVNLPDFNSVRIYSMDITDRIGVELSLLELNTSLEESVRIRTEELHKANEELVQDIARRMQTEKALKIEQQRFNDVLEILPVYLIMLTPDYHVTFTNRYFRENFGESHDRRCFEYLFNRSEPCENCESYKVLESNTTHHWEWIGPNLHIYDVYDFPLTDIDGSSLILEMGIDITEVRQTQDRLRDLNNYNRSLIEANLDTLVTITRDGKIGDVNAATENVTGYTREELIGTDFSSYFTDPEKARAGYRQVFETGKVRNYELKIQHKDGHITPVAYNASVYHDEDGNVIGVFASARDLTELKGKENQLIQLNTALEKALEHEHIMQKQLVQSEKFAAMGRMLASITHEINNPLQTIKNCLYLIQSDLPIESQGYEFLRMASSETERISNLVAQLREVYKPRQENLSNPLSLMDLLDDVHTLLSTHLQDKHVQWLQISTDKVDPAEWMINGIPDQIKQVVINISMNAIDAMQPKGGQLKVELIRSPQYNCEVGLRFSDTGPGILPEDLSRMFEPFFTTKSKGLGLGLAISYDIIQRHHGHIVVDSQPGKGATFEVWLPQYKA